ncbi:MAG: hydrogenobyrinic acid a,c-diamide synthase (glutamine-hydrolyzing) [Smithellaceae bacterium]|nr:hydrogenobyrinic acid a,c-diamide synthase (glutamine-hydrolyzing) [Smithellaceae bacterium]
MSRSCPRLVLAGLRGGAGKTTISVALAVALQKRGLKVVPFKKGPDYIDAAWLARAASGPCYNLDTFLIGREQVIRSFLRRAPAGGISLIEGNRGIYDGMNGEGEHSTAELAKLLRAPVILVVDCEKVTRTTAAMVLGCQHLDPGIDIQGVILNRVGGARHGTLVKRAIEDICRIPVLGEMPRREDFPFPERHLGLVPPQEHELVSAALQRAGELAEAYLDMEALIQIARSAPDWEGEEVSSVSSAKESGDKPVTIGVIRDRAFQFYYHENIEALKEAGARIVEISAIEDQRLPDLDALYIGGGFPETQAGPLAENGSFRRSLREAAADGLPIYAECGGLIYLGESLTIGEVHYPMAGALPVTFGLEKRPQGHGYTILEVERENPFFPVGTRLKGHEFHYCRILSLGAGEDQLACRVSRGTGIDGKRDGLTANNILAGFTHLHALGTPQWAPGMIGQARRYRERRKAGETPAFPTLLNK